MVFDVSEQAKVDSPYCGSKSPNSTSTSNMDVLANYSIFQELQLVHDTGYFSAMPSLEENWQQVTCDFNI